MYASHSDIMKVEIVFSQNIGYGFAIGTDFESAIGTKISSTDPVG
jgi:hypothetical protein